MRLIDADAVLAEITDFIDEYSEVDGSGLHNPKWCAMEEAKDVILNVPTVNAVPVVRCKDCRWGAYTQTQGDYMITCQNAESPVCGADRLIKPDWFCACGEPERRCES